MPNILEDVILFLNFIPLKVDEWKYLKIEGYTAMVDVSQLVTAIIMTFYNC